MDNSTASRNARRAHMLEKVRKLLAMWRDGRGNEHEQETALRQANKLMAEYGIAEAEADMAAINDLELGEESCKPDGSPAGVVGRVWRSCPSWAGILALGVATFTDSICIRRNKYGQGESLVFQGEQQDVTLARWLFATLAESVKSAQKQSGWSDNRQAHAFRVGACGALARRLRSLAAERRAAYAQAAAESGSKALAVVDKKAMAVAERFGPQRSRSSARVHDHGAFGAGVAAGAKINIPSGRPLEGGGQAARLRQCGS